MSMYSDKAMSQIQKGRELLRTVCAGASPKARRLLGFASTRLTSNPFDGLCGVQDGVPLNAAQMILGYSQGLFPMDKQGKLRWHCPDPRFVLHLSELRLSPNMRRDIRKSNFAHTFDREPKAVLEGCADRAEGTWLSPRLRQLYLELFELGVMHTVETWRDGALVGGSFGVAIGRIFTGETMFHRVPEAGKSSFAFLAQHLLERGFTCIDAQDHSDHMARFGARDVSFAEHRKTLALGLVRSAQFHEADGPTTEVAAPVQQPEGHAAPAAQGRPGKGGAAKGGAAKGGPAQGGQGGRGGAGRAGAGQGSSAAAKAGPGGGPSPTDASTRANEPCTEGAASAPRRDQLPS